MSDSPEFIEDWPKTSVTMSRKFVEGQLYRYSEIAAFTFVPGRLHQHNTHVTIHPDTIFRCSGDGFIEVVESPDPLVPSTEAQRHVETMRELGMTYREIARLTGLAVESIHRCRSGIGRIRQSTEDAIVQVSSSLNGQR